MSYDRKVEYVLSSQECGLIYGISAILQGTKTITAAEEDVFRLAVQLYVQAREGAEQALSAGPVMVEGSSPAPWRISAERTEDGGLRLTSQQA